MSDSTIRPGSQQPVSGHEPVGLEKMLLEQNEPVEVAVAQPEGSRATKTSGGISASAGGRAGTTGAAAPNSGYQPPKSAGAEYSAYHTTQVLASRTSTPEDLLRALSNLACSHRPGWAESLREEGRDQLRAKVARMYPDERKAAVAKLRSPELAALQQAAREGVGMRSVKNRQHTSEVLRSVAAGIDLLREELGVENPRPELTKKQAAGARAALDRFIDTTDGKVFRFTTHLDQQQLDVVNTRHAVLTPSEKLPHDADPRVCSSFGKDITRCAQFLERPDGSREWLITPREMASREDGATQETIDAQASRAVDRLSEFLGNDPEKVMRVSQIMNQGTLACATTDHLLTHVKAKLSPGENRTIFGMSSTGSFPFYQCRDNGDGTYTVTASTRAEVKAYMQEGAEDPNDMLAYVNPNSSRSEGVVTIEVDREGNAKVTNVSYDVMLVPFEGIDLREEQLDAENRVSDGLPADMRSLEAEVGIPPESGILGIGADRSVSDRLVAGGLGGMRAELAELVELADTERPGGGKLAPAEHLPMRDTVALLEESRARLGELEQAKDGAGPEERSRIEAQVKEQLEDLREAMAMHADSVTEWDGALTPNEQNADRRRNVFAAAAAVAHFGDELIQDYAALAAELDENRADLAGNADTASTAALNSRANSAAMQSRALAATLSDFYSEATSPETLRGNPELASEDDVAALFSEVTNRAIQISETVSRYQAGEGSLPEFGPGATGEEAAALEAQVLSDLEAGKPLPLSHPQLSERQLVSVRLQHFANEHPEYAETLRTGLAGFSDRLAREISNGDWGEARSTFVDVDSSGNPRQLTDILTPAPSMDDPAIRSSYAGRGVSHYETERTGHVANLAQTRLNDSRGRRLFSGLRHSVLASRISMGSLRRASHATKLGYVRQLRGDVRFADLARDTFCVTTGDRVRLLENPEHQEQILEWLREDDTKSAARELLQANFASNPALRRQALETGSANLTLDSVSMLAPADSREGRVNGRIQAEQENALAPFGRGWYSVRVTDDNGHQREIPVFIKVRQFNFATKPRGRIENFLRRIFGGRTDYDGMDAKNAQALTAMLGDPKAQGLGGEVADVLGYLRGGSDESIVPGQKAVLDDPDSAYGREERARLIEELAGQIKGIYNSGGHRSSSEAPYKMVSRVAMLSSLLGHTPSFNCRNGLDRTGQMDVETKLLAASMSEGRVPPPDAGPDRNRRMKFALSTGQLAMQEKATGIRRFAKGLSLGRMAPGKRGSDAREAMRNQFNSPLAQELIGNRPAG